MSYAGNTSLALSVEGIIHQAKMDSCRYAERERQVEEKAVTAVDDSMVSADLLEELKNTNSNCKALFDNLDGIKAQICERQLSYNDVMNALQNGTMNGLGPSPRELQTYANALVAQTREMTLKLESLRSEGIAYLNATLTAAKDASLSLINGDLYNWKLKQKKAQIGPRFQHEALIHELEDIEPNFEVLGAELRRLIHYVALLEKDVGQSGCQQFADDVRRLRTSAETLNEEFIKQSVIITHQPPSYLMKTRQPTGGTNRACGRNPCSPTLRVLGGQIMACGAHPRNSVGEVKCVLVNEEQAKIINSGCDTDNPEERKAGNLLHNTAVFEMPVNTKIYCAEFKRALQLIHIDRPSEEHETIPRQRYYLAFVVKLPFVAQAFWKLSLPVAALVHPRQVKQQGADAYMLWEYAFSHGDGVLTYVPRENSDGVAWPELAEALKLKFLQLIEGTKKGETAQYTLSDENLVHIAERFAESFWVSADQEVPKKLDYSRCRVTWEMFFVLGLKNLRKENDESPVPFWDWFYKCAEMVQRHLLDQWNRGLVFGFCSRKRSEALLLSRQRSTLMVKFSDSQFGSLIISFFIPQSTAQVQHLKIRADDLTKVAPENCVLDIPDLVTVEYIYPDFSIGDFRPEKKPEKVGRRSPGSTDKSPTDPYFTNVSVGFLTKGGGTCLGGHHCSVVQEWPVPAPPENWDNVDFQALIRDIEMSPNIEEIVNF